MMLASFMRHFTKKMFDVSKFTSVQQISEAAITHREAIPKEQAFQMLDKCFSFKHYSMLIGDPIITPVLNLAIAFLPMATPQEALLTAKRLSQLKTSSKEGLMTILEICQNSINDISFSDLYYIANLYDASAYGSKYNNEKLATAIIERVTQNTDAYSMDTLVEISLYTSITLQNRETLEKLLNIMLSRSKEINKSSIKHYVEAVSLERSKGDIEGPYSKFLSALMTLK